MRDPTDVAVISHIVEVKANHAFMKQALGAEDACSA